jgi:cell division protein FtsB
MGIIRRKKNVKTPRRATTVGKRRFVIAILAVAILGLLWSLVMGEMGAVKYFRMRAEANQLRSDIERLKQDNVRLMREVRSLKNDPAYLERLARDKIGLARPGEIVYYYGETTK